MSIICFCGFLYGQVETEVVINQQMGDTLWVVRDTGTVTVKIASLERFAIAPAPRPGKYNIIGSIIRRDTLGRCIKLPSRARLINVDTSAVEIRYTTTDTIPADGIDGLMLNRAAKFTKRE